MCVEVDTGFFGASLVGLSKVCLEGLLYRIWFFSHHQHLMSDQEFEMRVRSRSPISLLFASWNNIEVISTPATHRASFYVPVPGLWGRLETSRQLLVPKLPVL